MKYYLKYYIKKIKILIEIVLLNLEDKRLIYFMNEDILLIYIIDIWNEELIYDINYENFLEEVRVIFLNIFKY